MREKVRERGIFINCDRGALSLRQVVTLIMEITYRIYCNTRSGNHGFCRISVDGLQVDKPHITCQSDFDTSKN